MARSLTDGTGWRDSNDRSPPSRRRRSSGQLTDGRIPKPPEFRTNGRDYRQRRRQKTQTRTHNAQTSETLLRDTRLGVDRPSNKQRPYMWV